MRIHAKIKDLNEEYRFDSSYVLKKIAEKCNLFKKVFREEYYNSNESDGRHYKIEHSDSRLRELMSQIDKFAKPLRKILEEFYSKNGRSYKIRYSDPRLEDLISQVDKFRINQQGEEYESDVFIDTLHIRDLLRLAMSKKKNIDVIVYYNG